MKMKPTHPQKSPAQAMVEFALVLPILLLVIYGLIEVGRVLFIYSSVVSAARQAARYGSTTGVNASGVFRYRDCDGMRDAAQRVAFIDDFEDADIEIWHDEGEGVNEVSYCPAGTTADTAFTPSIGNINRVRVRVHTQYTPILSFVPLEPFMIESFSARTILVNVPIIITAAPQGWDPAGTSLPTNTQTPTITFTPSITPTASATGTPTYTPTASNTPTNTGTPTDTGTPTKTGTPTSTPTNTATPLPCDVRHGSLTTSPFSMTIINNAGVDIHISQIQVYWGPIVNPNETIIELSLGGVSIWTGNESGSPVVFSAPFAGDVSIPTGGSKSLVVGFLKNYVPYGTEQILVNFVENGCPTLDSKNSGQLP